MKKIVLYVLLVSSNFLYSMGDINDLRDRYAYGKFTQKLSSVNGLVRMDNVVDHTMYHFMRMTPQEFKIWREEQIEIGRMNADNNLAHSLKACQAKAKTIGVNWYRLSESERNSYKDAQVKVKSIIEYIKNYYMVEVNSGIEIQKDQNWRYFKKMEVSVSAHKPSGNIDACIVTNVNSKAYDNAYAEKISKKLCEKFSIPVNCVVDSDQNY